MKEFFNQMGSYFARYKGYIAGTLAMNILAALFNVFSFSILLPILQILFKVNSETYQFMEAAKEMSHTELGKYLETVEKLAQNEMSPVLLAAALLKMAAGTDGEDTEILSGGPEVRVIYIDAGSRDGIRIKDVLGAIAGECGIQGSVIGDIEVLEDHTLVEIPRKYVRDVLKGMKGKKIKKKSARMSLVSDD